jgi:hypothetical protein
VQEIREKSFPLGFNKLRFLANLPPIVKRKLKIRVLMIGVTEQKYEKRKD